MGNRKLITDNLKSTRSIFIGLSILIILSISAHITGTSFNSILGVSYVEKISVFKSIFEEFVIVGIMFFILQFLNSYLKKNIKSIYLLNVLIYSRLIFVVFPLLNIDNYLRLVLSINSSKLKHGWYDFLFVDLLALILYVIVNILVLIISIGIMYIGFFSTTISKVIVKEKIYFSLAILVAQVSSYLLLSVLQ